MLDQNTDRMWFVIGALVVGAGIILVANKSIPDIFSKVTDQFKSVTEQGTESIKNIHPYVNLIPAELSNKEWTSNGEFTRTVDLAGIIDERGLDQRYTLTFDIKTEDNTNRDNIIVYIQNGLNNRYELKVDDSNSWYCVIYDVNTEWKTYTIENVYFDKDTHFDSEVNAYLAFYGIYGTGNISSVKNIKLYATH